MEKILLDTQCYVCGLPSKKVKDITSKNNLSEIEEEGIKYAV